MLLLVGLALAVESGIGLDTLAPAMIDIPVSTAGPAPDRFPILGPFRLVGIVGGVRTYEAPHPVRPRALFYERQPTGLELFKGERHLVYNADPVSRGTAGTWEANGSSVLVRIRPESDRPGSGDYTMTYPTATLREESLRFRGGDARAWAFRSAQVDDVTRQGVLLSGRATVAWDVTIPEGAHLRFDLGILPPEVGEGLVSDGAQLEIRVGAAVVALVDAAIGRFVSIDAPLPPSTTPARLTLSVQSDDPTLDHVFVASPSIVVPKANPRRMVFAFIDTLRRDHLPTYGYERATAPQLDEWAKDAVVFEDARTVAPWTLPSARALWTGRHPELFSQSRTVQEVLRSHGWATGAYVGNVYLSSNFDMDKGWGEHGCLNWPGAEFQTWRARDFLRRHRDEDALLLVHFMDLHLPYKEPARYRRLWAGDGPRGLRELFNRTILMQVATHQRELVRPYLIDRYDQNLRYVDDQLAPLLNELGDNATVVLFADHGEEFFDHGDLEHGHTLYDELMRVPLVIKSPGLSPRRASQSVTLMDVSPTLLDLVGIPTSELGAELEGHSLVVAAKTGADPALDGRPVAIGRALYGGVQWGSVVDGKKYITTKGREELYDLASDRVEAHDLGRQGASPDAGRQALSEGVQRDVVLAFRIAPSGRPNKPIRIDVDVPGGVSQVWVGDDPTSISKAVVLSADGDTVKLEFESRLREHREVFIVPARPAEEIVGEVGVRVVGKMTYFDRLRSTPYDGRGADLSTTRSGSTAVEVTWAILPLPLGEAIVGSDGELTGALEALGYTTGEAPAQLPLLEPDEAPTPP